jgi:hypothetical protein
MMMLMMVLMMRRRRRRRWRRWRRSRKMEMWQKHGTLIIMVKMFEAETDDFLLFLHERRKNCELMPTASERRSFPNRYSQREYPSHCPLAGYCYVLLLTVLLLFQSLF